MRVSVSVVMRFFMFFFGVDGRIRCVEILGWQVSLVVFFIRYAFRCLWEGGKWMPVDRLR